MSITEKTFDPKKFARLIQKHPDEPMCASAPDTRGPEDINPCLRAAYIQILREGSICVAGIDFSKISGGDIDILENVLYYSPTNRLFDICEAFKSFEPAAATERAFI